MGSCYRTHWGWVTHIWFSKLTIIHSNNGGAKPLSEPILGYCLLEPWEQTSVKTYSKFIYFHSRKCTWKCRLENGGHFVLASCVIGIDTKIEVIVVSPTTWVAHHSPRAVVSFPGRWWHHNDRNRGINFYSIMMPQSILNLCRFWCV